MCTCNQGWRYAAKWDSGRGWRGVISDGDRTLWRCFHRQGTTNAAESCAEAHVKAVAA